MADIAYGFKGKPFRGAGQELKVYAIVIVCLLSRVCNILAMEGCETQEVVAAIERHSARVSGYICIDNGTQLKALKHSSMRSTCTGSRFSGYQGCSIYGKSSFRERTSRAKDQISQGIAGEVCALII